MKNNNKTLKSGSSGSGAARGLPPKSTKLTESESRDDPKTLRAKPQFFYPPGGILIWMIIVVELLTFTAGLGAYAWQRSLSPEAFSISQSTLNITAGFINTLVLLSSGFFIAEAVYLLKKGRVRSSLHHIAISISLGIAFLFIKGSEYSDKLSHGYDLTHDSFFTFYWLLTGFHFLHVLTGVVILSVLAVKIHKGIYNHENYLDVETGAAFWHLCDLIWLMLYPALYLIK